MPDPFEGLLAEVISSYCPHTACHQQSHIGVGGCLGKTVQIIKERKIVGPEGVGYAGPRSFFVRWRWQEEKMLHCAMYYDSLRILGREESDQFLNFKSLSGADS